MFLTFKKWTALYVVTLLALFAVFAAILWDILPAGHVGLYAQKTGDLLHLQGHLQIDLGLGGTVHSRSGRRYMW